MSHEEIITKCVDSYRDGMTVEQLADICGIQANTLKLNYLPELHDMGVYPTRRTTIARRRALIANSIYAVYKPGMSMVELAEAANCSKSMIVHYKYELKQLGVRFTRKNKYA